MRIVALAFAGIVTKDNSKISVWRKRRPPVGEVLDRVVHEPEADRHAGDDAGFDGVPRFIDAVLQSTGFVDVQESVASKSNPLRASCVRTTVPIGCFWS